MDKLKQKDVPEYRAMILRSQAGRCILCDHLIEEGHAALDHCHTTGRVRAVLHLDCNILLGKVENFLKGRGKRLRLSGGTVNFFNRVQMFMDSSYDHHPLHYKHLTLSDKKAKMYRKRIKSSKKQATKQKYRDLLGELK
jgi:hypothetical protein